MTWNEFLNQPISPCLTGQLQTDIDCPECGRKIYYDSTIILTSYPAKYSYWCSCGWQGYSHCKPPYAPDINGSQEEQE